MGRSNSFGGGKRRRGPEDEVYFDNYHTHKRYLTEVIASSMNGLSVSDEAATSRDQSSSLADPMLSPAPTEPPCTLSRSASSFPSQGDETSTLDSLMSEESDESVGYRFSRGSDCPNPATCSADIAAGHQLNSCSPSGRRMQKVPCNTSAQAIPTSFTWVSNARVPSTPYNGSWPRFPETEGRLPPSPNDPCQAPDLRRATLLRNLSMRAQLPAQPTSSSTVPDANADKNLQEQESGEEVADHNAMSCQFYEYAPEQVGCNTSIMGSPTHGVFPGHVVRGSPRVRSLVLGESTIKPKVLLAGEASISSKGDRVLTKVEQPSRFEEEVSFPRRPRSPRSPRSPHSLNAGASSSGFEISSSLSPKDGNVSDTESSFSRRSARSSLYAR